MLDKRFLIGLIIGAVIPTILFVVPPMAAALYAIPPTNAFSKIGIANNVTNWNGTSQIWLNATNYDFPYYIITDNSIGINITHYTP